MIRLPALFLRLAMALVLACAGLLDGYDCSVHWECLAAMQEAFPRVAMSTRLFTLDRNRFTSSGGTAPLDMMLHLISRDHGRELSAAISEMFVYERIRNEQDHQRVPLKHMLGTNQPKLQEIVALMLASLEGVGVSGLTLDIGHAGIFRALACAAAKSRSPE